ncbi:MAG TPA: hypothetical protein PLL19_05300, partial [Thiobacillaceae bacterium]|nr:hypothetical protein [Thiobacillaceae bacterium]
MSLPLRYLFLLALVCWAGLARAAEPEPMILSATAQGRTMDQAVAALTQAVVNHNYTFVRQQAIDSRLVPYAQEVR